jgi:hypothetical protein
MTEYKGSVPPCGIFCGACPIHKRAKKPCPGTEIHCPQRRCRGIYVCCIEKKGLRFCYECDTFPCYRFRRFAETWRKHSQDLVEKQEKLQELGEEAWLEMWNSRTEIQSHTREEG